MNYSNHFLLGKVTLQSIACCKIINTYFIINMFIIFIDLLILKKCKNKYYFHYLYT